MNGILRCSRYSFGPNRLHYCGPDANSELLSYISHQTADPGLEAILGKFRTLFPYLKLIAQANRIQDPFDDRVVEAYWIGNRMLDNIGKQSLYDHLIDELELKKRLPAAHFNELADKIAGNAVPHHSFHVLNIWTRTGHDQRAHTLASMDSCRIAWGKVATVDGPNITVETEPLVIQNGKLVLGKPIQKKLLRRLESQTDIEDLRPGNLITIHWDVPCEVVAPAEIAQLKKYTLQSIAFANQTI
ncbi:MAG: DUF6390 family protein [bacterium]|nr:DUF6390 family protein [bacterium]